MSYLATETGRDESFAFSSELQLPGRLAEALLNSQGSLRDDDWDSLWIDVGGEG